MHPNSIPSPSTHNSTPLLLVKIRVSGSGESDFYEVELPSLTYETLLKACAEEVEVAASQIAKIRKLPNIMVRRDRDVQRLKDGQELEVVLKENRNQLNIVSASMLNLPPLSIDGIAPLSGGPGPGGSGGMGLHPTSQQINGLH